MTSWQRWRNGDDLPDRRETSAQSLGRSVGIDWVLTNPLVLSADVVDSDEEPKQADAVDLTMAKTIGGIALDSDVCVHRRAFAARILLMTYASLVSPDVQRLRTFEIDPDAVRGALLSAKDRETSRPELAKGLPENGPGRRHAVTQWVHPLVDLRAAYRRVDGRTFVAPPHCSTVTGSSPQGASPCSTTRRRLASMRTGIGDPGAEATPIRRKPSPNITQPDGHWPARSSHHRPLVNRVAYSRTLRPQRLRR